MEATDETLDWKVKQVCAPLFATGLALEKGHNQDVINATVTFFKFRSRVYAVTCHHVLSTFFKASLTEGYRIAPSIHIGRQIHQLGAFEPDGAFRWAFKSCREFAAPETIGNEDAQSRLNRRNADQPDIAIADLTANWSIFAHGGTLAIDLDSWAEPDWSQTQPVWLAFGFPDGHKYQVDDRIAAPMPRVRAELVSSPTPDRPRFLLCSSLTGEHGWGFSGLSGGPVLVAHKSEDRYAFVGITFEGSPGAKDVEANIEAIYTGSDIVLAGYIVGPSQFEQWLSQSRYEVRLRS